MSYQSENFGNTSTVARGYTSRSFDSDDDEPAMSDQNMENTASSISENEPEIFTKGSHTRVQRLPGGCFGFEYADGKWRKAPGDEWLQRGEEGYLPERPRRYDWAAHGDLDWTMIDDINFPIVKQSLQTEAMRVEWDRVRNARPGDRVPGNGGRIVWKERYVD
jgi:hypothetical protein